MGSLNCDPAWPGNLRPGEMIQLRGFHANGQVYRWWQAIVESATTGEITVVWPAGTVFEAPTPEGRKVIRRDCRSIFWPGRWYFITEAYEPDGRLGEIFADIASPPRLPPGRIEYTDHELDVIKTTGNPAWIDDEDEFLEAAQTYGYSDDFQRHCRQALAEALELVERWVGRGDLRPFLATRREDTT